MSDRNNPTSFSNKVVDLKPRGGERVPHSPFGNFVPDEELLQSTARIKAQRDVILDRLSKMTESSSRVSKSVFEKVRRDYTLQLETVTELLVEKKQSLKEEIKKLYTNREKLSFEINRHKEILEEAEFRHFLNEFTETQYQEVENFETREVEKLELDLSHISQWIRTHEELFDQEDFGQAPAEKKPAAKAQPAPQASPVQPQQVASDVTKTAAATPQATEASFTKPVEQPVATAPKPAEPTPSLEDFSYLFNQDDPESIGTFGATETNIKELLDAAPKLSEPEPQAPLSEEALQEDELVIPEPSLTDSAAPVVEESITVSSQASSLTEVPSAPQPAEPAKPVMRDDSISNILDSIHLDGEEDEGTPPVAELTAPSSNIKTEFKLTMLQGDLDQSEFAVPDNTSIGRSPSNDVVLKEPKVSRQHAAINKYNDNYIVIDLKSSNGVYVNGTKIDECVLHDGDEISIGGYKFLFQRN